MTRAISEAGMVARAREQQNDISRRSQFLAADLPTQMATLKLLRSRHKLIAKGEKSQAEQLFFRKVNSKNFYKFDKHGVDWMLVDYFIREPCFGESEWTPWSVVPHRVGNELVVLESLMEEAQLHDQDEQS